MDASYAPHNDAVQAFHTWRRSPEVQTPGLGGNNLDPVNFIPRSTLEDYLRRDRYMENLLSAVLDYQHRAAVGVEYVREHYLLAFATLLCIGEGRLIYHFQQHRSLRDEKMPFDTQPTAFPHTDDPKTFERFQEMQWQFCAMRLEYDMKDRLRSHEVLPIISKEKIGEGGSAIIYKIVVYEPYNFLRAPEQSKNSSRQLHRNTFVLKTYRGPEAEENHKTERNAYMKLRWAGRPSPHIIAFYGWFTQGSSYNLILEYADEGTLENFLKRTPPPNQVEDVLRFWDRLTFVLHGIQSIHGKIGNFRSASQILKGWHQDVKPANILVFGGNDVDPYDCEFKISDLGLAHFKPSDSQSSDTSDLDAFGTRAYGAPETYRPDAHSQSLPLQVTPYVDIWSIGCIFSEASVWAVFGWNRVREYRRQRRREIEEETNGDVRGEEIFHWDGRVLKTVNNIHQQIKETIESRHWITRDIVDRVIGEMLQPRVRPAAHLLLSQTKRLIKEQASRFGVRLVEPNSGTNMENPYPEDVQFRLRNTPQPLPDNSSDEDGLDIHFTQTTHKATSRRSSAISSSIYQQPFVGVSDMRGRLQNILQGYIDRFGTLVTPSKPSWLGRHQPPHPQRPLSLYVLTDAKWQPTDVGGFIKDMIQSMKAKDCPKEHVGIQFIRFGEDPASITKLDDLDHGLGLKAEGM
ncbi:MAG: hypothetical protein Q9211_004940 [Gyalolechia sp. 1 TL-2023]